MGQASENSGMIFQTDRERVFWSEVYLKCLKDDKAISATRNADEAVQDFRRRCAKASCPKCGEVLDPDLSAERQHWVVTGGIGFVRICGNCCDHLKVELNPGSTPPESAN